MSAESVWYVDSSAIVKLVAMEPETPALSQFLAHRRPLVSSSLASTEVRRAVLPLGGRFLRQATDVLARFELVRVSDDVLEDAGRLEPAGLRSLNAIHLATAALFGNTLGGLISYDRRMSDAALSYGWSVHAPS